MKKHNIIEEIGHGTYSKVLSIKKDNKLYAMKSYKGDKTNGIPFDLIREVSILKLIISPYIIPLLEIDYLNFEYILLPIFPFSLSIFLKTKNVSDNQIKSIFSKISLGLYALHCEGIVHRDLKPSNILIEPSKNNIVIIDNGLSKNISYKRNTKDKSPRIISLWYRPPEIFLGYVDYTFEVDIWSLGIILLEMYIGKNPFSYYSDEQILNAQAKLVGTRLVHSEILEDFNIPEYPGELSSISDQDNILSLLLQMLEFNYKERISISQVLNSMYLSNLKYYEDSKLIYEHKLKNWISPYYYENDNEIRYSVTVGMRKILLKWIFDVCNEFHLSDNVYFLTCALLDRYLILSIKTIDKNNFQLVGIGCLLIASKCQTVEHLVFDEIINKIDNCSSEDISQMEKNILRVCKFDLIFPLLSSFDFEFELSSKKMKEYLFICTLYPSYLRYPPYEIVKSCISLCINEKEENDLNKKVKKWITSFDINEI